MKISLRNLQRQRLFTVEVNPKSPPSVVRQDGSDGLQVTLNWDGAQDDEGHLRRCPACGCRDLFVRKDFPQVTGFSIIVLAVVISMVFYYHEQLLLSVGVLVAVAVLDALIFFLTGRALVCYRCRSEFRGTPIRKDHAGWELATGEKYRQVASAPTSDERPANGAGSAPPG